MTMVAWVRLGRTCGERYIGEGGVLVRLATP